MQATNDDNSIMLIRAEPQSVEAENAQHEALVALRGCKGEVVVFFHGAGVDHACGAAAGSWQRLAARGLRLEVCSAAWQRRHEGEPEAPFVLSSLVRFWHRVATGYRLVCHREAGRGSRQGATWVIIVTAAPSEADSREILELVLAGASLELPLAVIFRDRGCGQLVGEFARGWRQLVDFDLASLYYTLCAEDFEPGIPASPLDREQAGHLCNTARGVICP